MPSGTPRSPNIFRQKKPDDVKKGTVARPSVEMVRFRSDGWVGSWLKSQRGCCDLAYFPLINHHNLGWFGLFFDFGDSSVQERWVEKPYLQPSSAMKSAPKFGCCSAAYVLWLGVATLFKTSWMLPKKTTSGGQRCPYWWWSVSSDQFETKNEIVGPWIVNRWSIFIGIYICTPCIDLSHVETIGRFSRFLTMRPNDASCGSVGWTRPRIVNSKTKHPTVLASKDVIIHWSCFVSLFCRLPGREHCNGHGQRCIQELTTCVRFWRFGVMFPRWHVTDIPMGGTIFWSLRPQENGMSHCSKYIAILWFRCLP